MAILDSPGSDATFCLQEKLETVLLAPVLVGWHGFDVVGFLCPESASENYLLLNDHPGKFLPSNPSNVQERQNICLVFQGYMVRHTSKHKYNPYMWVDLIWVAHCCYISKRFFVYCFSPQTAQNTAKLISDFEDILKISSDTNTGCLWAENSNAKHIHS